jgi:hypothetical protein
VVDVDRRVREAGGWLGPTGAPTEQEPDMAGAFIALRRMNDAAFETDLREIEWSGCLLTDTTPTEEMQKFVGSEVMVMGQPGVVESIEHIEGTPPWTGRSLPKPRPRYRVVWRLR